MNRRPFIGQTGASLLLGASLLRGNVRENTEKCNILMIAVDDLRPQPGCYGHDRMVSPNIDRLASEGILFERAYCQVPVCGASRASLLTGVRPTSGQFLTFDCRADTDLPDVHSIGKLLKNAGYYTVSRGKVFHHNDDSEDAWSDTPWRPRTGHYRIAANQALADGNDGKGPPWESADVADNAYADGMIADRAVDDLRQLAAGLQPFFLAVGFLKPHLPFVAPAAYWNNYNHDDIDLAENPFTPEGAPDQALTNWAELRAYYGMPASGPVSDDQARMLIHGYYACVSYVDHLVGRLLDELDALDLPDRTIVVLWGDHGWNLGEHGLWCKYVNFETTLRSPLVFRIPGFSGGKRSGALVEYVDIYPTLCELCGIASPDHLEGTSMVPLFTDPDRTWKSAVFSRYQEGDSIKTDQYRYTEWPDTNRQFTARMLYDHKNDPDENVNIAELPGNQALVVQLSGMLASGWKNANIPSSLETDPESPCRDDRCPVFCNYTNPFNSSTILYFKTSENGRIRIVLYDNIGRTVLEVLDEFRPAGIHEIELDGSDLVSGVYLCIPETGKGKYPLTITKLN